MINILVTEPEYFTPESLRLMKRVGRVTARRMSREELLGSIANFDAVSDAAVKKSRYGPCSKRATSTPKSPRI